MRVLYLQQRPNGSSGFGSELNVAMPGIRRFSAVAVVALFTFSTAALWARSWSRPECLSREVDSTSIGPFSKGGGQISAIEAYSMHGGLDIRCYWYPGGLSRPGQATWRQSAVFMPQRLSEHAASRSLLNRLGFFWDSGVPRGSFFSPLRSGITARYLFVGVPYWVFLLPVAMMAGHALVNAMRNRGRTGSGFTLRLKSHVIGLVPSDTAHSVEPAAHHGAARIRPR